MMRRFFSKLKISRKQGFLLLAVVGFSFLLANFTYANWVTEVLGWLAAAIVFALGEILILLMGVLIYIAQYNNFINSGAVANGWVIVRDLCNMFFVVVLLVIAFGTILQQPNYSFKKWLPKLVIMAILINFSKTICGLIIDFGQVVMLTFVNAFKDIGGGNLTDMLGIKDWQSMQNNGGISEWEVVGAYFLAVIYVIISVVVIITMIAMLVMRMIMLWVYIVLSPAAYLMAAFPGGQSYSSRWWSDFIKNVIIGPVLAFFIWLSFVTITPGSTGAGVLGMENQTPNANGIATGSTNPAAGFGASDLMVKFIISIGMLLGGLKIAQEIGGEAGGFAGKAMGQINRGAKLTGAAVGGFALGRAKGIGKAVGRSARNQSLGAAALMTKGLGNKIGDNKVGNALQAAGGTGLAWRKDMRDKNKKRKVEQRQKFLEKMGMGEKTMDKTSEYLKTDAGKEMSTSLHGVGVGAVAGLSAAGPVGGVVGAVVGGALGGAMARLAGWKKDRAAKNLKDKEKKAEPILAEEETLSKEARDLQSQSEAAKAAGDTAGAKDFAKQAKDKRAEARAKGKEANKITRGSKFWKNTYASTQAFTSEITQKGAAKGSSDIKNAKVIVSSAAKDSKAMMKSSSASTFYSNTGGQAKKVIEQLISRDNADSGAAIQNLTDYISTLTDRDTHDLDAMAGLARGIAAAKKGGMDTGRLNGLIAMINSKKDVGAAGKHGLEGATVESLNDHVVAYRKTGQVGEKGSGVLAVDTLAKDKGEGEERNMAGVDFGKLKDAGVDIDADAEGANFSGSQVVEIASAMIQQINTEQSNLQGALASGEINQAEFDARNKDLEGAKAKLSKPEELGDLSLVNTASKNFGRQEKMASVYHEEIHRGGVEDEELTENVSKSLMANKLYGRNPETKGRHATELAQLAQGMKEKGTSNEDIMRAVDQEIKARVAKEGQNRAARVLKLESGEKESENEALGEEEAKKAEKVSVKPEIDTKELQASVDELAKKFADFKLAAPQLLKPVGAKNDLNSFALKSLFKNLASTNSRLAKKLSTPLEADVLIQSSGEATEGEGE